MAEAVEGAVFFEVTDGAFDQVVFGVAGVFFAEFFPGFGPGGLAVGEEVFGVEGGGAVVVGRCASLGLPGR